MVLFDITGTNIGTFIIVPEFPVNVAPELEYNKNLYVLADIFDIPITNPEALSESKFEESASIENLGRIVMVPCMDL